MIGEILSIETAEKLVRLKKRVEELEQINEEHCKINGELRKTINKAIEYVENENTDRFNNPTYEFALELRKNKLLEILKGKK